ncbi:hypothetical protein AcW1_005614 [Taiwanofungus camphoratus]|nr:hypothetical protein AcW1_005614 [Antrodia cinnamomea]
MSMVIVVVSPSSSKDTSFNLRASGYQHLTSVTHRGDCIDRSGMTYSASVPVASIITLFPTAGAPSKVPQVPSVTSSEPNGGPSIYVANESITQIIKHFPYYAYW